LLANAQQIQGTLAHFGIEVTLGDITKGPIFTRYELHPASGVNLRRISNLSNNLAATLKAESVKVLAPIPGKSSVGIEMKNPVRSIVTLREIVESNEWTTAAHLPLAVGVQVDGQPLVIDLAVTPHLLVAGSTGSGKSACIDAIIASLLMRLSRDEVRFVMIDPKGVDLLRYTVLPHLVVPVITELKKSILALRWVITELNARNQIFAQAGVESISGYNARRQNASNEAQDSTTALPLGRIVVIISEFADLMHTARPEFTLLLDQITRQGGDAGIHLVLETDYAGAAVVPGSVKARIPARIAFRVPSRGDSMKILDQVGAEELFGDGDLLYLPPDSPELVRAQGTFVSDGEITAIIGFISNQLQPADMAKPFQSTHSGFLMSDGCTEDEELIQQCIEVIRSEGKASVSILQ
jgi:S-DNA-T family DNA segregation ATPase FtsK/SpoIIIE